MRGARRRGRQKKGSSWKITSESGQDRTGLSRVTEGCGRQTEMEAAACEIISGAPTTLWVKGQIDRDRCFVVSNKNVSMGHLTEMHCLVPTYNSPLVSAGCYRLNIHLFYKLFNIGRIDFGGMNYVLSALSVQLNFW